ncbi:MAG: trypsin-like peptidase domain-containing protein [Phycisphaera sp. RhM]|nr:trypsin-like peptidase domain-containing protein [Phycisphaera sp. RhM]
MKVLVTSVCFVLVVAQLGYLSLVGLDGELDHSKLPDWMTPEAKAVSDAAADANESTVDAPDRDDTAQDQGDPLPGPMPAERVETLGRATAVRILDANQQFVGSGIVVAKREGSFDVVTAYHVIEKPGRYGVESFRTSSAVGTTLRHAPSAVKILRSDPDVDLAYLRVSALIQPAECVSVTSAALVESILSEAWIIDCTGSGAPVVSKIDNVTRQTARRSQDGVGVSYWRLDQESSPGMSGSALLDAAGRLIGVASGNSDGSAYYCEVDALHEFVDRGRVQNDAPLGGDADVPDAVD